MNYELHPLCTLFPRLNGAEFDALSEDIKANGLREPITLHEGLILDGGNRYAACVAAGVQPEFRQFVGTNIVSFVLSANLHRRHMTAGQQAAIVASAQQWAEAHAPHRAKKGESLHPYATVADRAAQSGASHRTQQHADKVAKADPELAKQVAHGEVSLPAAVEKITGKRPGSKPAPELVIEDDGPSAEEIAEAEAAAADDAERVRLILESDNALAAMTEKCKQQAAQIRILEERVRGLTNEAAQAIRLAKSWRTKFERLEKAAA